MTTYIWCKACHKLRAKELLHEDCEPNLHTKQAIEDAKMITKFNMKLCDLYAQKLCKFIKFKKLQASIHTLAYYMVEIQNVNTNCSTFLD